MTNELKESMAEMEDVMCRTADRCDIWQDRVIYAVAKALWRLLKWAIRIDTALGCFLKWAMEKEKEERNNNG